MLQNSLFDLDKLKLRNEIYVSYSSNVKFSIIFTNWFNLALICDIDQNKTVTILCNHVLQINPGSNVLKLCTTGSTHDMINHDLNLLIIN